MEHFSTFKLKNLLVFFWQSSKDFWVFWQNWTLFYRYLPVCHTQWFYWFGGWTVWRFVGVQKVSVRIGDLPAEGAVSAAERVCLFQTDPYWIFTRLYSAGVFAATVWPPPLPLYKPIRSYCRLASFRRSLSWIKSFDWIEKRYCPAPTIWFAETVLWWKHNKSSRCRAALMPSEKKSPKKICFNAVTEKTCREHHVNVALLAAAHNRAAAENHWAQRSVCGSNSENWRIQRKFNVLFGLNDAENPAE